MIIKLVRHGQSQANTREVHAYEVGDHRIPLTERGHEQAREAGGRLGAEFLATALVYCSPLQRTRQTLAGIFTGAGVAAETVRVYEDPRLREVERGYVDYQLQEARRETHGWFYYRFEGGESPADCHDRTSTFLESLMRQAARKQAERALVVTHGLTIRCFVMRFLHLTVEEFDRLDSIPNCGIVTIGPRDELHAPVFTSGRWGVVDLPLRPESESARPLRDPG